MHRKFLNLHYAKKVTIPRNFCNSDEDIPHEVIHVSIFDGIQVTRHIIHGSAYSPMAFVLPPQIRSKQLQKRNRKSSNVEIGDFMR